MALFKQLHNVIAVLFLCLTILTNLSGCGAGTGDDASEGAGSDVAGIDTGGGIGGSGIDDPSDPGDGGIGGSGIVAIGPIDQFGSICVNGVCYDISNADVFLDGRLGSEDELALGMFVRLQGTVNADGVTGTASRVDFETFIFGPIQSIALSEDGVYKVVTVLNTNILIHPNDTFFEGGTFDDLTESDWIKASGRPLDNGVLLTTQAVITPAESIFDLLLVRVTSTITEINGNILTLESGLFVNIESATLSDNFNSQAPAVGQMVEVVGLFESNVITATTVSLQTGDGLFEPLAISDTEPLQLLGQVEDFVSNADFTISGIAVDASAATIEPSFITLSNNIYLQAAGINSNNTLVAETIFIQDIREEGTITNINTGTNVLTLSLERFVASIDVLITDDTNISTVVGGLADTTLADLSASDLVIASLSYNNENVLIADTIVVVNEFSGVSTNDPAATFDNISVTTGTYTLSDQAIVTNYTQSASANLTLNLGTTEFGRLVALEDISLAGSLTVTNDSVVLRAGDTYDLFDGNIQGQFNALTLPDLNPLFTWDIAELYNTGVIRVVNSQAMEITVDSALSSSVRLRFFGSKLGTVSIDWGDSTVETVDTIPGIYEHTYSTDGQRTISISGGFTGFGWEAQTPEAQYSDAITGVSSWGNNSITSLYGAFRDHDNLLTLPNNLPSTVTNLRCLVCDTAAFNDADIASWDLSNVTNISSLFQAARLFNQDIGNWNVSTVTDMANLFNQAISFDQNIGNWDVSNVTDMTQMFNGVTLSPENYDTLLSGWSTLNLRNNVTFDGGNAIPSDDGRTARTQIINDFSWTITDGDTP